MSPAREQPTGAELPPAADGIGLPGGLARGRALVARSIASCPSFEPGTVLVVERLPAAWVPLLRNVAAVVAETGGALSSAATLTRERGIPAVFGVDGATRTFLDGDAVEVDAVRGVVCLIR